MDASLFKMIVESVPNALVLVDSKGKIKFVNRQTELLLGFKGDELVGQPAGIFISHDSKKIQQYLLEFLQESKGNDRKTAEDWIALRKNKSALPIEINLNAIDDRDGKMIVVSIVDITQRKRAEERFSQVVEAAPNSLVLVNAEGRIVMANYQTEKLFGYTRNELIGKEVELLIPGRFRRQHPNLRKMFFGEPQSRPMGAGRELFALRKDGTEFPIEIGLNPIDSHERSLVLASIIDITERKKTEDRIFTERGMLRSVIDNLPDYIYVKDPELKFVITNRSFAQLVNASGEKETLGKNSKDLFGDEVARINVEEDRKVFALGEAVIDRDEPIFTSAGKKHWLLTSKVPLKDKDGKVVNIVGISKDITERKKAEEQQLLMASIVNSSDDAIISKTLDSMITSWNHGAEVIFGFSAGEVIGKHISLLIPPDRINEENEIMSKILRGEHVIHYETERKRKDGKLILVSMTVSPIKDPDGIITGASKIARDLSYRKEAEEERAKSEIRFRNTLDNMLEGAQIIGFDWRYLYVNESFTRHAKYTREELLGFTVMEKYPGIEDTEVFKVYKRCFEERVAIHLENQFVFPDQSIGWFELSFQPVPEGIFILSIDITERKKAENKIMKLNRDLILSEMKFRGLIEHSHDAIGLTDEHGEVIYRSPAYWRMTGWNPEDFEHTFGKAKAFELIHPEDREAIRSTIDLATTKPGEPLPLSYRFKHKENHYIWLDGTVTNLLQDESIKCMVTNLRDITKSKKAEQKIIESERIYRTIASSIPRSVICLVDRDYRYSLIEGDMLEKFGYTKQQLLGHSLQDVILSDQRDSVMLDFTRVFDGESFMREDDREAYQTITNYVPLTDEIGNVYAAMTVTMDVTELRKAERAVADLNASLEEKIVERTEQLDQANKELEAFSYSVSHDLRAPLRAVSGYAKMLEEDYQTVFDDNGNRLLKTIQQNAARMGQLIDDLLTFSRLGRKGIQKSSVDMNTLVQEALADLNFPDDRVKINVQELHGCLGESALLKQVWLNYISNAIKYSSKTENPLIEIGSVLSHDEITYSVRDNGSGFDMAYVEKLFKVFQRLHRQDEFEGTGVGLAIVDRIIRKHGGNVGAQGELGKGAVFYFTLPVEVAISHENVTQ